MRGIIVVGTLVALAAGAWAAPKGPELVWADPRPQGNDLRAVWSSGKTVWAVGDAGAIVVSNDDGKTWKVAHAGGADLWAVWGSSPKDVYATGDGHVILHTTDGGKTWTGSSPDTGYGTALAGVWGSG